MGTWTIEQEPHRAQLDDRLQLASNPGGVTLMLMQAGTNVLGHTHQRLSTNDVAGLVFQLSSWLQLGHFGGPPGSDILLKFESCKHWERRAGMTGLPGISAIRDDAQMNRHTRNRSTEPPSTTGQYWCTVPGLGWRVVRVFSDKKSSNLMAGLPTGVRGVYGLAQLDPPVLWDGPLMPPPDVDEPDDG